MKIKFKVLVNLIENNYFEIPNFENLLLIPAMSDSEKFTIYNRKNQELNETTRAEFVDYYGYVPCWDMIPHYSLRAHDMPGVIVEDVDGNPEKLQLFRSKFCTGVSVVFVSDNMTGKMFGIPSISTNCLMNSFCIARRKNGESICAHCFAAATIAHYNGVEDRTTDNFYALTSYDIPMDLLPHFKSDVNAVRFESFGDLQNTTHYENFLNIAEINPQAVCTLWTKNTWLTDGFEKPENMVLIQSSVKLNQPEQPANEHIDHVFTVYTAEYIAEHGINITCGARDCNNCRRCYVTAGAMFEKMHIAEMLK